MADPFRFTNFERTDAELEDMLLFSILVAGKRADQTQRKLRAFLAEGPEDATPFEAVMVMNELGLLGRILRKVRIGQYKRVRRAFSAVVELNPRTCTLEDLEAIPGVGPKTARMFLLHSRPGQRYAVLDTHILAFLRELGYDGVPKTTPPAGPRYRALEATFLAVCDRVGIDPATFDLSIWKSRTRSKELTDDSTRDVPLARPDRRRPRRGRGGRRPAQAAA